MDCRYSHKGGYGFCLPPNQREAVPLLWISCLIHGLRAGSVVQVQCSVLCKTVRYYGHYSNVSRGKRKQQDQDGMIPSILEPVEDPDFSGDGSSKARPPRPETGTGSGGATDLPVVDKLCITPNLISWYAVWVTGLGQGF